MLVALVIEQCWHRVPGGTASSAVALAHALADRSDIDVIGVTAEHRGDPDDHRLPRIPLRSMRVPRPALYAAWQRARRGPVELVTGPVDVIHATGYAIPPKTAPLVITLHDVAFLHDRTGFTRRGLDLMLRAVSIAQAEGAAVICPSEVVAADCARAGIEPDRLRVVPHGVDPAQATADERLDLRRRHRLDNPFVLFVGTPEPRKGLGTLAEAMARVDPGVDLVLAGPAGWAVDLDELLGPLGHRARRVGYVSPSELRSLYAEAELFCYPSRREGFGMPVLEAMAQGTAVVTTADTSMAEFATGAADLVAADDVSDLADAINGLLGDPLRAASLGRIGRETALAMPWSLTAARTRSVYAEVAA